MLTSGQFLMGFCSKFGRRLHPTKGMEANSARERSSQGSGDPSVAHSAVQTFTFKELARATNNFSPKFLSGHGIYKGKLGKSGKLVAIKKLDTNNSWQNKGFLTETLMLSVLHHQNLINLVGYCAQEGQRLLVYEFMPLGSLEKHLFGTGKPLDWNTRMKIAIGVAQGLEYLHNKASPPVIHRNLNLSTILLDRDYNPKISNLAIAKLGPVGDKSYIFTSVVGRGSNSIMAPEYAATGQLSVKVDVYSFGIILLQLITGRGAGDGPYSLVQSLVTKTHMQPSVVDPVLEGRYPMRDLNQARAIAAMCLVEKADDRPSISEVVAALSSIIVPATDDHGVAAALPSS